MKTCYRILALVLAVGMLLGPGGPETAFAASAGNASKAAAPKDLTIDGSKYVAVGKKITLKTEVTPEGADAGVRWKSSDKKTATVTDGGVVKGIRAGKVKITATSAASSGVKATLEIRVMEKAVASIRIEGSRKLDLSEKKQTTLRAEASPASAAQSFEWKSSDRKVARVSQKGVVTAVSAGKAVITAAARDGSGVEEKVTVTVTGGGEEPTDTPKPTETDTPASFFEISGDTLVAYKGLGKKKEIVIPKGVKTIAKEAFLGDKKLERVTLPDSVEDIRDSAFAGCTKLKEVVISEKSGLRRIRSKAFAGCGKLDQSFAKEVEKVAKDAFAKEAPTDHPVEPTPTPEPTEEPAPYFPSGGRRQSHGKSQNPYRHDYDAVELETGEEGEAMQILTLGGEEMELTLEGEDGKPREFTARLEDSGSLPEDPETAEDGAPENGTETGTLTDAENGTETPSAPEDGAEGEEPAGDTLILSAVMPAPGEETLRWKFNGGVLRKLLHSGVLYLGFQWGTQLVVVPTEGFLAGWAYDDLRSRGAAGRWFDYELTLAPGGEEPAWRVKVDEKEYSPGADELAPMFVTGVRTVNRESPTIIRKEENET